jgi:asparagine synthase (glutamine-hydrolysing)
LTAQLADALRNAVKRRTLARLGKPGVLLSGGADSRVCVFGAETPEKVSCYTLFDEPNEELATARRIVAAAGAAHTPLPRDADYYALNAENSIRIAGGMWSFVDTHYTGMIPRFSAEKLGTVMTGCYVDYMLKGLAANRQHRRLFGRVLPLYDFAPFNFQFYSEHQPVAEPWQTQLQQRWQNRFPAHLRENYAANRLALEDLRLRPLAREADAAGRGILWRTLPWDPPIADTEVLAVFEKMSPASKVNGIVFGRAVAEVCGAAGRSIANNNYGTPVGASEQQRTAWFLWAVAKRKVRRALGLAPVRGGAVSTGSWPVWEYYLGHSPTVAQWWADVAPGERARFTGWLGEDPWKKSPAEAAEADAMQMARVLTLQRWLRQRGLTA